MTSMLLHIDGSSVMSSTGKRRFALGWGLVAHFAGNEVEVQGAIEVPQELRGSHETIAFIEAVLFANARGYEPQDVTVYTDDEAIGYANWSLHPGNYQGMRAGALEARVRRLTMALYSEVTCELVLRYLRDAVIHKLRGHRFLVNQERADYLAKHCAWRTLNGTSEPAKSVTEWLLAGLEYYERDAVTPSTWHAPFTAELAEA